MNEKTKVARLSIASNTILTLGKLGIGISMNSVSVISEAIHSGLDLLAAILSFLSVRESAKPADERHQYGHGKFENLASIIEALLILAAAGMIIYNAYPKLFRSAEVHALGLGTVVMGISAAVNFFVSRKLMQVARKTESPALAADAWHLRTDVYTSLGVLAGIVAIKLTGLTIIDPIIAIAVALLIVKAGIDLIRDSMHSILDVNLPEEDEGIIRDILREHSSSFVEFHKLRTRKAGSQRYVDLHLVVPSEWAINKVHTLCDHIEADIKARLKGALVLIHTEPCAMQCRECSQADEEKKRSIKCEPVQGAPTTCRFGPEK
ncbi:cation diffusion facilitator family transporter [Pelotomaculum propionicicum]|uniref:Ferrous-iron efflux pump FieF n=1 Tax=Pelotomaculum propionicicum TaxID=258475 RepID=A0A4Y7RKC7_9FIRM|nr:cation diffusion facilitator family transporter [Pelotomaculum propionicicum]NLI13406.1 cation transporter [Peptococcaceae bacterium]TEB09435.1 Ferrous-iron efflux pump FieF [Pelotomaculum propionicicum]